MSRFIFLDHPDGHKVIWPEFPKAFALFEYKDQTISISDIFRDPAQQKGSAGKMLADAIKAKGISNILHIRFTNILDTQPTINQLCQGIEPSSTVLGATLLSLTKELGLRVKNWEHGTFRGKVWIQVNIG